VYTNKDGANKDNYTMHI